MLDEIGDVLRDLARRDAAQWATACPACCAASKQGNAAGQAAVRQRKRDLLDLFTKSARDVLDGWFESDAVKAAFGFDAVVGNFASPDTPGSAYVLLHHTFGEVNGKKGAWGHASAAWVRSPRRWPRPARRQGRRDPARLRRSRACTSKGRGKAVGVQAGRRPPDHGPDRQRQRQSRPALQRKLVPPSALPADFRADQGLQERLGHLPHERGAVGAADFTCLPGKAVAEHHQSGIVIAPSLDYMDAAYRDAKATGHQQAPRSSRC
jgi:hypothetical protein